jgi:hypothetical protein
MRSVSVLVQRGPTAYFSSGYMASFSGMPSSSRRPSSSERYSVYWPLFSTLNLTPETC